MHYQSDVCCQENGVTNHCLGGAIGPFTAGQLPAKYLFPMVMVSDGVALVFLARIITRDVTRIYRSVRDKRNEEVMGS